MTTDRNGVANSAYNFSGGSNVSIPMTSALHNLPNRKLNRPKISCFTTCFHSFDKLYRPFRSLLEQTCQNWEWVIVDDSKDDKNFIETTLKNNLTQYTNSSKTIIAQINQKISSSGVLLKKSEKLSSEDISQYIIDTQNIQNDIDRLMDEMNSKKDDYKLLKEKIEKIKEKEEILTNEIDNEKKQHINIQNDIRNVQKEIDLYDSGKCPTCRTDFNSDYYSSLRESLVDKKEDHKVILLLQPNFLVISDDSSLEVS